MNAPKISVIVPVYNVEKYLQRCIESILSQTFTDFEVLLIDDGSNDRSGEICDEYAKKDGRIRVFHKENGGVSSARNLGLEHMRGEWVCFVDSDDWVNNDYIETILKKNPEADLIFWGCNFCYPDGSQTAFIPSYCYVTEKENTEAILFKLKMNLQKFEYLGYTWNKAFKASIIKKQQIKFIENLCFREDEAFTLEYSKYIKSLRVIDCSLYNYDATPSGLTYKEKRQEEYELLIHSMLDNVKCFNNKDLLHVEYNYILSFYLDILKIASKKLFSNIRKTITFIENNHDIIYPLISKNHRIIFKYKSRCYLYIVLLLYHLLFKKSST